MSDYPFIKLNKYPRFTAAQMLYKSQQFYNLMSKRRSVRHFADDPVPREVIINCIKTAATAPNGANMQPWHFVLVSEAKTKKKIRLAAEREEHDFYNKRATAEWLKALAPLATDESKPFLEVAPYLIVIFEKRYGITKNNKKVKYYYTRESVGIATGILITALHRVGLATLTHTPSPMKFLNDILDRPVNETPFLILVVGYPEQHTKVPDISKKSLAEITSYF